MELEIWLPVVGYEHLYHVSNFGRIKSLTKKSKCRGGFRTVKEKILKPQVDIGGYLTVGIYKESICKIKKIHVLVANAFIPNPENKRQVNHKDGSKKNNHVSNLEWNTSSENMNHAHSIGLVNVAKGERQHNSRLKSEEVIFIFNSELDVHTLALKFNVKARNIYAIKEGQNWSHLTGKKYARDYKRKPKS